ncbi:hypothetical protein ACTXL0_11095 [Psychrobacter faecalis]|jgi:hypothetical protein|uniref:hypothetical protein n=1 Tax=Psychrobacter faecalis TaxID=180588 RepID=UPI00259AD33B|nr:hypothetical protein [uncultured Psychrobacter sp.]
MKKILKIFYFYIRPEGYALYRLDNYYFVDFLDGGLAGGTRTVQITEQSFNELMSNDYNFDQIIYKNMKIDSLNKSLKVDSHTLSSEPYMLFNLDNNYFIELWKKQRTGQSQAIEIDEKDFNQLSDETILPSQIL